MLENQFPISASQEKTFYSNTNILDFELYVKSLFKTSTFRGTKLDTNLMNKTIVKIGVK